MKNRSSSLYSGAIILFSSFLFFFFSLLSLSLFALFLKLGITQVQFWFSLAATFIYALLISRFILRENYLKYAFKIIGIFLGTFLLCVLLSGVLIDLSFDGQGYHQAGVVAGVAEREPVNVFGDDGFCFYVFDCFLPLLERALPIRIQILPDFLFWHCNLAEKYIIC